MSSKRLIRDSGVQTLEVKQHQQANIAQPLQVTSQPCARQVVLRPIALFEFVSLRNKVDLPSTNRNDEPSINPATPCLTRQAQLRARRICYFQRRTRFRLGHWDEPIRGSASVRNLAKPQFHHGEFQATAWHRGTPTGSFPSPRQGKLSSLLSAWT